jgi:hypothetical protein
LENVNKIAEKISTKNTLTVSVVSDLAKAKQTDKYECTHNLVSVAHKVLDLHLNQEWN